MLKHTLRAAGRCPRGASRCVSRRSISTQPAPSIVTWPHWTDVWAADPKEPLSCNDDCTRVDSYSGGHASALAEPIMRDGVHELCFAVKGGCLAGVAAAKPDPQVWNGRAWALDAPRDDVLHAPTAVSEHCPAQAAARGDEQLVLAIVDMITRRLTFLSAAGRFDLSGRLPSAVGGSG